MEISKDKTSLRLAIDHTLNAEALDKLITQLALVRMQLKPEVPINARAEENPPNVMTMDDPYCQVAALKDGRIRIWLRSPGFGWQVFNLPAHKARGIAQYIMSRTVDESPASNLDGMEGPMQ